jgi:hypothetical protein
MPNANTNARPRILPPVPTPFADRLVKALQNPFNWKLPTAPFVTYDKEAADELGYALDFYMGGHELQVFPFCEGSGAYTVTSAGYYHYVGA